jgi:hypothetical protein
MRSRRKRVNRSWTPHQFSFVFFFLDAAHLYITDKQKKASGSINCTFFLLFFLLYKKLSSAFIILLPSFLLVLFVGDFSKEEKRRIPCEWNNPCNQLGVCYLVLLLLYAFCVRRYILCYIIHIVCDFSSEFCGFFSLRGFSSSVSPWDASVHRNATEKQMFWRSREGAIFSWGEFLHSIVVGGSILFLFFFFLHF